MINLNRAQILGNLTKDPEMRFTPNGQAVSSFSVATNRKWKGRDGQPDGEATDYHNVVVWGKQAETVTPMLKKGNPVLVEGRIQTRSWEGQDGAKRYTTEIVAEQVIVLNGRGGGDYSAPVSNPVSDIAKDDSQKDDQTKGQATEEEIDIEDIPF